MFTVAGMLIGIILDMIVSAMIIGVGILILAVIIFLLYTLIRSMIVAATYDKNE